MPPSPPPPSPPPPAPFGFNEPPCAPYNLSTGDDSFCTDSSGSPVVFTVLPGGGFQAGSVWDAAMAMSNAWCVPNSFVMVALFNATDGTVLSGVSSSFFEGGTSDACVGNNVMFFNAGPSAVQITVQQQCLYALDGDLRCHGQIATDDIMPSPPPPSPMQSCYRSFCCSQSDDVAVCQTLADVYYSTGGGSWRTTSGWATAASNHNAGSPLCSFAGVTCDEHGAVISLNLAGFGLSGSLSSTSTYTVVHGLESLAGLRELDLSSNPRLSGALPQSLSLLSLLTSLSVGHTSLSGMLPINALLSHFDATGSPALCNAGLSFLNASQLANCSLRCQTLDPQCSVLNSIFNSLTGAVWQGNTSGWREASLGVATDLCTFAGVDCDDSRQVFALDLSGRLPAAAEAVAIPPAIANLTSLKSLNLGACSLAGSLPHFLFSLQALTTLRLGSNRLRGGLPDLFGSLSALQLLDLSNNAFTGLLPNSIASLSTLSTLVLRSNLLTGSLDLTTRLTNLVLLDLSGNNFSVTLPDIVARGLTSLLLNSSAFSGSIPASYGSLSRLQYINLSNNSLTGTIDSAMWQLPALSALFLNSNALVGTVPAWTGMPSARVDISRNLLSGQLPPSLDPLCAAAAIGLYPQGSYSAGMTLLGYNASASDSSALALALANPCVTRIEIDTDISLDQELRLSRRMVTIAGLAGSSAPPVLSAPAGARHMNLSESYLALEGVALSGGSPASRGGAVYADSISYLTASYTTFFANVAQGAEGGSIYSAGSPVVLSSCSFLNNSATEGGALYVARATVIALNACTFTVNSATAGVGGAVYAQASTLASIVIESSNFTQNVAHTSGGALAGDTFALRDCTFVENTASTGFGGAVYSSGIGAAAFLSLSTFSDNHATSGGALAFVNGSAANLTGIHCVSNAARRSPPPRTLPPPPPPATPTLGGCIWTSNVPGFFAHGLTAESNDATSGGACAFSCLDASICYSETHLIEMSSFAQNRADGGEGGAVLFSSPPSLQAKLALSQNNFSFNSATGSGGAVAASSLLATSCNFTNNAAQAFGGAVFSSGNGNVDVSQSHIALNTANAGGAVALINGTHGALSGAVCLSNQARSGGCLYLQNVSSFSSTADTFDRNSAGSGGGAVISCLGPNACLNVSHSFSGASFSDNVASAGRGGAILFDAAGAQMSGAGVSASDSTFSGNNASTDGGSLAGDSLFLSNCSIFKSNALSGKGGAVFAAGDVGLSVRGSSFRANWCNQTGGAVAANYSLAAGAAVRVLGGSSFAANFAGQGGGGALSLHGGVVQVSDMQCTENSALQGAGGCLLVSAATQFTSASLAIGHNAARRGGGVSFSAGAGCPQSAFEIFSATFDFNAASDAGGAIFMDGCALNVTGSAFSSNVAVGETARGGGFYLDDSSGLATLVSLVGVVIVNNSIQMVKPDTSAGHSFTTTYGQGFGGGIFMLQTEACSSLSLLSTNVSFNGAASGAGVYVDGCIALEIFGSQFAGNAAAGSGGAVSLVRSSITSTLQDSNFTSNAAVYGAAISLQTGTSMNVSNCAFFNQAASYGAVLMLQTVDRLPIPVVSLSVITAVGNTATAAGPFAFTDSMTVFDPPPCLACNDISTQNTPVSPLFMSAPRTFNGSNSTLECMSGVLLPSFSVRLYDIFDQPVQAWPVTVTMSTVSRSASAAPMAPGMLGVTTVPYALGVATFSSLTVFDNIGTEYTLRYTLNSPLLPTLQGDALLKPDRAETGDAGSVLLTLQPCGALQQFDSSSFLCICTPGAFHNLTSSMCEACPVGSYASQPGSPACTSVSPGFIPNSDSTGQLPCQPGYVPNITSWLCEECPTGFNSKLGSPACTMNPPGVRTATVIAVGGSTSLPGVSVAQLASMNLTSVLASILNVDPSSIVGINTSAAALRKLLAEQAVISFSVHAVGSDRAAALSNAIAPAAGGAASVFSEQTLLAAGIPVTGPPVVSTPKAVSTGVIVDDKCSVGSYQKQGTSLCLACEKGKVAPSTPVAECTPAPANTFTINTTTFILCPLGSTSAAGSYLLSQCMCGFGHYPFPNPVFDPSLLAFECLPCPDGGVCNTQAAWEAAGSDGTPILSPLAAEGFWRHPNDLYTFYDCEDGFCLEEEYASCNVLELLSRFSGMEMKASNCLSSAEGEPGAASEPAESPPSAAAEPGAASKPAVRRHLLDETASKESGTLTRVVTPLDEEEVATGTANCRIGHRGVVCSECIDGWTLQSGFCTSCPAGSSLASNPALLNALSSAGAFFFLLGMIFYVMGPILTKELTLVKRYCYKSAKVLSKRLGLRRLSKRLNWILHLRAADSNVALPPVSPTRMAAAQVDLQPGAVNAPSSPTASALGIAQFDKKGSTRGLSLIVMFKFCRVPMKMAVENFQIITSFKKRIKVAWPAAFASLYSKVSFLNLDIFTMPATACLSPNSNFFSHLNTMTLGATALLGTLCLLWFVGLLLLRRRRQLHRMQSYNASCLSKLISLMTLLYAPLVETILSTFSCRTINGEHRLMEEPGALCEGPLYYKWYRIACFWTVFYVLGIPALNYALLRMYRIPTISRELAETALFRAAVEHAMLRGMELPHVVPSDIFVRTASDEFIGKLYAGLADEEEKHKDEDDDDDPDPYEPAAAAAADHGASTLDALSPPPKLLSKQRTVSLTSFFKKKRIDRKQKMAFILDFAGQHCAAKRMTWMELPKASEEEAELKRARRAIGSLFSEFYSDVWFWALMEAMNKLVITGGLAFIDPGKQGQTVSGMGITLCMLLVFLKYLPYAHKTYRHVGYGASVTLFLFFVVAYMLQMGTNIHPNPAMNDTIFSILYGTLVVSIFGGPALLSFYALYKGLSAEEEEEAQEEEEEVEDEEPDDEKDEDVSTPRRIALANSGDDECDCLPAPELTSTASQPSQLELAMSLPLLS